MPGDADRGGRFDADDFVLVLAAGEYKNGIAGNSTFSEGDWNGDQDFDSSDLVFTFQSGAYIAAPAKAAIRAAVEFLFNQPARSLRNQHSHPKPGDGDLQNFHTVDKLFAFGTEDGI